MPKLNRSAYTVASELVLGQRFNCKVPKPDQARQRLEAEEILHRLRKQPGVILADEVGMGKTFVALAVAHSVAMSSPVGPVIVMVPTNLVDKWAQDLKTFCELYLDGRRAVGIDSPRSELMSSSAIRFGVARHSVDLMKLLDDKRSRCHLIFLTQGAMSRRQTDRFVRLALIAEALRRHGRGKAHRLIKVKFTIPRFMGSLLQAVGQQQLTEDGEEYWQALLDSAPSEWKRVHNERVSRDSSALRDEPVPKSVARAIQHVNLKPLADALSSMPLKVSDYLSERVKGVRHEVAQCEVELWKYILARSRWRSPLLVMDEAHHLKNPGTSLARQLQSHDSDTDLRTGDGAMARKFDRMLFLTATPFQLGHTELVHVMKRFGDVRWHSEELGEPEQFAATMADLQVALDDSQRSAILLQQAWSRLQLTDHNLSRLEDWWLTLVQADADQLDHSVRAVLDAYQLAREKRRITEAKLRSWIIRHNKPNRWDGTDIARRERHDGAAIIGATTGGIDVPPDQLLPFFLAARADADRDQELLGEALSSSYEAFRSTRSSQNDRDDHDDEVADMDRTSLSRWYRDRFDEALGDRRGAIHPTVAATVQKTVDLWERGEKVLVFAFYRQTCRALRIHISQEIKRRMYGVAVRQMSAGGTYADRVEVDRVVERIQRAYFDRRDAPGYAVLTRQLERIIVSRLTDASVEVDVNRKQLLEIMRRFLRVPTTLLRYFPLREHDQIHEDAAVSAILDATDHSAMSWRDKFNVFLDTLTHVYSSEERQNCLDAAANTQTGAIHLQHEDVEEDRVAALANVQEATGLTKPDTRARLMRSFNTPFFPDILVCSQVMGEGVDLQRFCRHVIHHDLAWNPSTIEQRTGRIDRIGCKAQGQHPIMVYLPYLAGTADERQYRVMTDRDRWFRVVMGQDEVANLIKPNSDAGPPLPEAIARALSFNLGIAPGNDDQGTEIATAWPAAGV